MQAAKLLIFDLDGTLIDSQIDVGIAVNRTLTAFGEETVGRDIIRAHIGTGVRPLIAKIFERKLIPPTDVLLEFDKYYSETLLANTTLYPGMSSVLASLQQIEKAILTNKHQRFVDPIVAGLQLAAHFRSAYGRDAWPACKPDPRPVQLTCASFDVLPEHALVIGDTITDINAAKSAGSRSCAVTYGYGDEVELQLHNPDFIVRSPTELGALLKDVLGI